MGAVQGLELRALHNERPRKKPENQASAALGCYTFNSMSEPIATAYRKGPVPGLAALFLALGFLAGCLFDGGGGSAELPEGTYFIAGRFDQSYAYEQYFVVLPDRRWEWVEYGSNAATVQLCKATRVTGAYSMGDSAVTLTQEAESAPLVKCGMTKADFKAIALVPIKDPKPVDYDIRTVTDKSFEARAFFGTKDAWKEYVKEKSPFGFHE